MTGSIDLPQRQSMRQRQDRIWFPLMHWEFDQAAINAYKLATVGKTWTQGHLEFQRALYTKLLAYSELVKP